MSNSENHIDLLCIGHCCHDVVNDGYILGGTVSYASMVAKSLGHNAAVLTSVGTDFRFRNDFDDKGISFYNISADKTTVFENIYQENGRIQYMHSRAGDILREHITAEMQKVPLVLVGPIAKEIDFGLFGCFSNAMIGVTIQGFIRKWDDDGFVSSDIMDWEQLGAIDVVILSDDDLKGMEEHLNILKDIVGHIVVTKGAQGAVVYKGNQEYYYPAFPADVADVTGAGDAFTTGYILEYHRTRDVESASVYAHCTASFVIGGEGVTRLPSSEDVAKRTREYRSLFLS